MVELQKAIEELRKLPQRYGRYEKYYDGEHGLAFATDKFTNAFGSLFREFSLNLCPAVVDAVKDKLIITDFKVEEGSNEVTRKAWQIWQLNKMPARSIEVHKEALKTGDAYVIVWPDELGNVRLYPQKSSSCTVFYDSENPGKIIYAAKLWLEDSRFRINLFYPDRVEKYESNSTSKIMTSLYQMDEIKGWSLKDEVKNIYGQVPVFHFANNSDIGCFGQSELKQAIHIQDALNKSVLDMMVAMEFQAYRQRWASGIEIEYDKDGKPIPPFQAGVSHLWISENPDAKFGDFAAADLEQFLKVKESFRIDMAATTGTPLHYFMLSGAGSGFPQSGFSLLKQETRFINKVRDRQQAFGAIWDDVMTFALRLAETEARVFTEWEDPAPLSEKERLENLLLKKDLGVSEKQLMTEAGYGETDIENIQREKDAVLDAAARAFNSGEEF